MKYHNKNLDTFLRMSKSCKENGIINLTLRDIDWGEFVINTIEKERYRNSTIVGIWVYHLHIRRDIIVYSILEDGLRIQENLEKLPKSVKRRIENIFDLGWDKNGYYEK